MNAENYKNLKKEEKLLEEQIFWASLSAKTKIKDLSSASHLSSLLAAVKELERLNNDQLSSEELSLREKLDKFIKNKYSNLNVYYNSDGLLHTMQYWDLKESTDYGELLPTLLWIQNVQNEKKNKLYFELFINIKTKATVFTHRIVFIIYEDNVRAEFNYGYENLYEEASPEKLSEINAIIFAFPLDRLEDTVHEVKQILKSFAVKFEEAIYATNFTNETAAALKIEIKKIK